VSIGRYAVVIVTLALTVLVVEVVVGHAVPLRVPLQELPFRVGPWIGRVEILDQEFMARARPDEALSRRYADDAGSPLYLYVGYYARGATRGQVQAVCHGECRILSVREEQLDLMGGRVSVNRALTRQDGRPVVVLYWFQQGSQVVNDPYRGKAEQALRVVSRRRSDGALVRISVPVDTTDEEAWERGVAFAGLVAPLLRGHFAE
jgi:EpsI family protein